MGIGAPRRWWHTVSKFKQFAVDNIDLSKAGQKLTATLSEHMQGIFARFLDGLPAGRRREFLSVAAELGAYLGKEGVS